jgi:Zn ribbon nucleic-acid-binding protein
MTPEYRIETEKRITSYLESNDVKGIRYMQVEQTFNDLGVEVNVWNVKAEGSNWWLVEGEGAPMNLYTQDAYFFSADEAYSFHMGITQRLQARYHKEFKHVVDELPLDIDRVKSISRKLNSAAQQLNDVSSPEDIQSVGLICRESLIELGGVLVEDNPSVLKDNDLKASDFKGIAKAVIQIYASGGSNSNLRKHCRSLSESAWEYACEIVHSPNKNIPDAKICLLLTCSVVSIFQNLYLKHLGFDAEPKCSQCKSMDYEILSTNKDTVLLMRCNNCGFEEEMQVELVPATISQTNKKTDA